MVLHQSFIVCLCLIGLINGDFNCRRKGFSCKNRGTCNSDGTCGCPPTHTGYDCSVENDLLNCDDNPCSNNGICYDEDKCFCTPDYYGDRCQYKTVSSECLGTEIQMTFVAPKSFKGDVYVGEDETNCKFNKVVAETDDLDKYILTIPFNSTDNLCSKAVNQTKDEPVTGDLSRYVDVVVSYNPMFISNTDSIIIYSCVHKGSNFTMFAELDDVGLDERTNLKKDLQQETYMPVKFVVLDKDSQPLEKPLFVGDIFKLLFFLSDTGVYETIKIDNCVANNTLSTSPIHFEFVKDGCPTEDGKNILVNTEGPIAAQYTRPGTTLSLPASELFMYAFKFKETTNVGFNCAVRMCKKGDENFCEARDCSVPIGVPMTTPEVPTTTLPKEITSENVTAILPEISGDISDNSTTTNDTLSRSKRSAHNGDRQFVSAVLTVQEPSLDEILILPNINNEQITRGTLKEKTDQNRHTENGKTKCDMSQNIIIVIVVLATIVFVLVVISAVLMVTICRKKRKIQFLKDRRVWEKYTIPRPKFDEKGNENFE